MELVYKTQEHIKRERPNDERTMELLETVKGIIERGERPELRFDINVATFGSEWCLVTMPHEMFCEYELWVDENAPFDHTMVFAYTNGHVTYIGTDKDLALGENGGYESGSLPYTDFHALHSSLHVPLAVGIEGMIKGGIVSLWTE